MLFRSKAYADNGIRPVIPALKAYASSKFYSGVKFFKVGDLGGWGAVDKKFFGKGGTWDQIFKKTR